MRFKDFIQKKYRKIITQISTAIPQNLPNINHEGKKSKRLEDNKIKKTGNTHFSDNEETLILHYVNFRFYFTVKISGFKCATEVKKLYRK